MLQVRGGGEGLEILQLQKLWAKSKKRILRWRRYFSAAYVEDHCPHCSLWRTPSRSKWVFPEGAAACGRSHACQRRVLWPEPLFSIPYLGDATWGAKKHRTGKWSDAESGQEEERYHFKILSMFLTTQLCFYWQ